MVLCGRMITPNLGCPGPLTRLARGTSCEVMRLETLQGWANKRPFRPFSLLLPSDRKVKVPHPEFMFFDPSHRYLGVWDRDGSVGIYDVALVAGIEGPRRKKVAG